MRGALQELVTTLNRKAYKSEVQRALAGKASKGVYGCTGVSLHHIPLSPCAVAQTK